MGTIADTALTVVDHLRSLGRAVGCIAVTAFRPFPADELREALGVHGPSGSSNGSTSRLPPGNPLTREVEAALYERAEAALPVPRVRSFSAGARVARHRPGDLVAVFDQLVAPAPPADKQRHWVLGIRHPLALDAPTWTSGRRALEPTRPFDRRLRRA